MEDEFEQDFMGVGKENDEQVMLQNRLRRHGHYTVQRSRPISYPPCFSLGAFNSPLYMKGSLMDRKPQKLIEPICEELSTRIGRKVKFADEAGKQLVSYIEIPSKFDRFGFRSLTNISSIFEEVMGKDLHEIEQVFDSAFSASHVQEESRSEYKENTDSSLGCKRKYHAQSHACFPKEKFPRAQSVVIHHPKETNEDTMYAGAVGQGNDYSPQQPIKIRKHNLEGWAISETDEENKSCSCDRVVKSNEVYSATADSDKGPHGQPIHHSNAEKKATESDISLCDISTRSWQPGDYRRHRSHCNRDNLRYKTFRNIPCDRTSSVEEVPILHRRTSDKLGSCRKTVNSVTIAEPNEQLFEELIKKLHSAGQGSDSSGENNDHTPVSCPLSVNHTPVHVHHTDSSNVVQAINNKEESVDQSILNNCPKIEVSSERLHCRVADDEPLTFETSECETFRKNNANEELSFTVVLARQPDTTATTECSRHTGVTVDYTLPFESRRQNNTENKEDNVMTSSFDDNPNISFTIISPTPSCSDVTAASKVEREALNISKDKLHTENEHRDSPNTEALQEENFITETNAAINDILSVFDEVSFPEFTKTSLHSGDLEHETGHKDNISTIMFTPINNLQPDETSDIYNVTGTLGVNRESESGYGTHSFISDDIFNEDTQSVCTSGFDLDDVFEEDTSDEVNDGSNSTLLRKVQESVNSGHDIKSDWKTVNSEADNSLNTGDITQATLIPPFGGNDNDNKQTLIHTEGIAASSNNVSDSEDCILNKQYVATSLEGGDSGYQYIQDCKPTEDISRAAGMNDNGEYNVASMVNETFCDISNSHASGLTKYTNKETPDISLKQSLSESYSTSEHPTDDNLHCILSRCFGEPLDDQLNLQGNVKFSQNCNECQLNVDFRPEHPSDSDECNSNNALMQNKDTACDSYASLLKNGTKSTHNSDEHSSRNVQLPSVINSSGDVEVETSLATDVTPVGAFCADQGSQHSCCDFLQDENLHTSVNDNSPPIQCYNLLEPAEQQGLSSSNAALELDCNSNGLMEKPESFASTVVLKQDQLLLTQHEGLVLQDDTVESSDMEVYMPKNLARTLVDCIFRKKSYHETSDSESSENSVNTAKHKIPERRPRRDTSLAQRSKRCVKPLQKRPLFIPHGADNDPHSGSESDIESFTSEESQGGSDVIPRLQFMPDIDRVSPCEPPPAAKLNYYSDKEFECSNSTSYSSAVSSGSETSDNMNAKGVTSAGDRTDEGTISNFHQVSCSSDSVDEPSSQGSVASANSLLDKEASVSTNKAFSVSTVTSETHSVESSLHSDACRQGSSSAREFINLSDDQALLIKSHSEGLYQKEIHLPLLNSKLGSPGGCSNSSSGHAKCNQSNVEDSCMIQVKFDEQNFEDTVSAGNIPAENKNSIADNKDLTSEDYSGSTGRSSCDESCLKHNMCSQNIKVNCDTHTLLMADQPNIPEGEKMECKEVRSSSQSSSNRPVSANDHNFNITVIITSEGKLIVQNDGS